MLSNTRSAMRQREPYATDPEYAERERRRKRAIKALVSDAEEGQARNEAMPDLPSESANDARTLVPTS